MALSNLYLMNEHEIITVHNQLAENFFDDDLYKQAFPNEKTRMQLLVYFFKQYVRFLKPYSYFVADSKELRSVLVIFDSSKEMPFFNIFRMIWLIIKLLPLLFRVRSRKSIKFIIICWEMFTSRWIREFVSGEYYHLDLLYTSQEYRGQGYAMALLHDIVDEAKLDHRDVTIETHHEDNLMLYKKAGFVLMSEIIQPTYGITQYNLMLRKNR